MAIIKTIIETDKIGKDINSKLYSDLHYVPGDDLSFLKQSIDKIKNDSVDYVFFLGDLIDDSKYTVNQLREVLDLLARVPKFSKVILVLGNHDQFTRNTDGKWEENYNTEFVQELKNMGINVLQNESYSDDNINVYGTQFPGMYYEHEEPIEQFLKNIHRIEFDEKHKFNILAEHSPKRTFDKKIMSTYSNLKDIDLVLAGHIHNGCIPWYLNKVLPTNRGLIDPNMNIFPDNARGTKKINENTYGIISTPLTTFGSNSPLRKVNDIFYPPVEQDIMIKKLKK